MHMEDALRDALSAGGKDIYVICRLGGPYGEKL